MSWSDKTDNRLLSFLSHKYLSFISYRSNIAPVQKFSYLLVLILSIFIVSVSNDHTKENTFKAMQYKQFIEQKT